MEDERYEIGAEGDAQSKSPSNRRDLPLFNGVGGPSELGVDRLSVSFAVDDYDPSPEHWEGHNERYKQGAPGPWDREGQLQTGTVTESHSRIVEFDSGVHVFVGVQVVVVDGRRKSVFGKIEYNPARFVDPCGFGLASVTETIGSLLLVVRGVDFLVIPESAYQLSSYNVKRIDVAKDFHFPYSTSVLIRGLATYPRTHARKLFVHSDPSLGGAQTLTVGSYAGVVRLYDKWAQTKGKVGPGTVRWEAEARTAWAKAYGGIRTAGDLNEVSVSRLAMNRWEWSGMGSKVLMCLSVKEIAYQLGISESEASSFYGWLVDRNWTPSATTLAKYRSYQRQLGIAIGDEPFNADVIGVRLDWDLGAQVIRNYGEE